MSVPEKREKLRKQGRCVVCFGTRHVAKDCPTKGTSGETNLTDIMTEAFCSYDGNELPKVNEPADAVISV